MKKPSSHWMKQQPGGSSVFTWQAGYGVFSIGQSQLPTLLDYIDHQEEHHRTSSFKDELLGFLEKYGVELIGAACIPIDVGVRLVHRLLRSLGRLAAEKLSKTEALEEILQTAAMMALLEPLQCAGEFLARRRKFGIP